MKRIGTAYPLTEVERTKLLDALAYWHRQVSEEPALVDRDEYEKAFDCVWDGQNASGVRTDTPKQEAWPFEGASDQRLRWGEKIYLDQKALVMIAISTCEVEIVCGGDQEGIARAGALKRLLTGLLNALGAKGVGQILAMLHYMLVDTPAVAALDVGWRRRSNLAVRETTAYELEAEYAASVAAQGGAETVAAVEFRNAITGAADMAVVERVAAWLVTAKGVRPEDAERMIEALGEDDEVEYCSVVTQGEGPELKALRYGEDFCIPVVTDDFDYASPWFRGEWVTESQLRERITEDDWDAAWVEETLNHKGIELFTERGAVQMEDVKELVNLVWCYTVETDDDGVTTRYVSVLSHADGSAFGKRVVRTRRGKWNTAFFRREVRNGNILNSRGIALLASPAQGTAKAVRDMAANNAIVGSLPPVKAQGSRVRNVLIEPFAVVNMGQNDNVSFMQPPAYPAAAKETEEKIKAELLDYWGVSDGQTDVTERRREFVSWMLEQWRDLLVLLLETAQDNASDDYLVRATASGDVKGVRSEDISGPFQLRLKLDPVNLDNEKLINKVNAVGQILQNIDRKGTVDTDPFVRHAMTMLFPEMATTALKSADQVVGDEVAEEEQNFVKIKAGVMPRMDTEGKWNYGARLEFYQRLQAENPDAIAEMSPRSQEMLQQWMAALEQQNTQYGQNAQIGRTGVPGVTAQ